MPATAYMDAVTVHSNATKDRTENATARNVPVIYHAEATIVHAESATAYMDATTIHTEVAAARMEVAMA